LSCMNVSMRSNLRRWASPYSLPNQSQNQTWLSLCKQDEECTMKLMRIR
jgi:hypothetical protein